MHTLQGLAARKKILNLLQSYIQKKKDTIVKELKEDKTLTVEGRSLGAVDIILREEILLKQK